MIDINQKKTIHPLQQFALHEWFDHVVGGGEVPRLVDEVHGFETGRERILADKKRGKQIELSLNTPPSRHLSDVQVRCPHL